MGQGCSNIRPLGSLAAPWSSGDALPAGSRGTAWLTATGVPNFAVLWGLVAVTEAAWDVYRESGQCHPLALIATKECRAWLAKFGMSYDAPAWQQAPGS